ncbi:MAG: chloride channel protein [Candidatus Tectomicrobia bacterium]|nr:chloride channel protein [Candidatus Tectomicrobia bacterium]
MTIGLKDRTSMEVMMARVRGSQGDDRDSTPGVARLWAAVRPSSNTVLLGTAVLVGLCAGLGAIIFRWLIDTITHHAFTTGAHILHVLGPYYVILIPALGGLVVGPLIYFFAREAKGHGVPEVMEAVALRGGRIRPIVVIIKSLASSVCIGTGGAVGREGPIVQIGSALGSSIGQWLGLSDDRLRNLVACGAAGGIAATFNAPIAGVIFALEVILGDFSATSFSTVVIASVTASELARIVGGNIPAFDVAPYALVSPWELPLYAVLGVIAALVGVAFVVLLYKSEDLFDAWTFPEPLKPVVGGLLIGLIGLVFPQIFGVGYSVIEQALHNTSTLWLMAVLVVAKLVATSLTIGSGGSGGVFAPSLFLGAMLGGSFGTLVHTWWPSATAPSGAYALVGMAAVFAAAARAPISAVLILFEMTDDYRIILPLMLTTVISISVANRLSTESIYTLKLSRRGVRLSRGQDVDVMQTVRVSEVMDTEAETVLAAMPLEELALEFERTHHHSFPVLDAQGLLYGIVSIRDLERAMSNEKFDAMTAGDIATVQLVTVSPDEPVATAIERMAPRDLSRLPVVEPGNVHRLLGIIRRGDIGRAYNVGMMRRAERQHRAEQLRQGPIEAPEVAEFTLDEQASAVGMMVHNLPLPDSCLVVAIRRGDAYIVPHGPTSLEAGDHVIIHGPRKGFEVLRKLESRLFGPSA